LRAAQDSAGELARRLLAHPGVVRVRCPGLPDDPHHAIAATQMAGFGAVVSFEVADAATADAVCASVRIISHATSLGGVESTIERRAKLPGQQHVPAGLVRLAVGGAQGSRVARDGSLTAPLSGVRVGRGRSLAARRRVAVTAVPGGCRV